MKTSRICFLGSGAGLLTIVVEVVVVTGATTDTEGCGGTMSTELADDQRRFPPKTIATTIPRLASRPIFISNLGRFFVRRVILISIKWARNVIPRPTTTTVRTCDSCMPYRASHRSKTVVNKMYPAAKSNAAACTTRPNRLWGTSPLYGLQSVVGAEGFEPPTLSL